MKHKKIVVAIAAVATIGFIGINQVGYQGEVESGIENIVNQLNEARLFGEDFDAELTSLEGGIFSSSGIIAVKTGPEYRPTEFEVGYTVNHGVTTFLTGASYDVNIINSVMDGNDEVTLTSVLFNGEPITVNGSLDGDSIKGILTVPTAEFSEGRNGLKTKAIVTEFYASDFDDNGSPYVYEVLTKIPFLTFTDRREAFELTGVSLALMSEFDGEKGSGTLSLEVHEASVTKESNSRENEHLELKDLAITMGIDLKDELTSDFALEFDEINIDGQSLSDVEISYTLAGIDSKSIVDIINLGQKAAKEGWSEHRVQKSVEKVLMERADNLLTYNPRLEINRIKAKMNGDLLIDAEGIAKLDASKLPQGFLKSSFEYNRPPNPQELIKAILVDFEAKLGDKASETAANINPMAAALMSGSGNKFTFKIENGETTMNGERL